MTEKQAGLTPPQEALVRQSRVVERVVRTTRYRRLMPEDELRAVAHLALCEAARRYDADRGVPFDGFAWLVVHRAVTKAAIVEQRHTKSEVTVIARDGALETLSEVVDPGDVWADDEATTRMHLEDICDLAATRMVLGMASAVYAMAGEEAALEQRAKAGLIAKLRAVLATMDDADRRLLEMRYFERVEFEPIGAALGKSVATVRRHHLAALTTMGKRLRQHGVSSAAG